jgi:hypothetical protein
MSFKINDLDKFMTEDFEDDESEIANIAGEESIAREMGKLADVPENETGDEEDAIPPEEADVVNGFEMEPEGEGYLITYLGEPICFVVISCQGKPVDMETIEKPSECVAVFSNVIDSVKTLEYKEKLEGMGIKTVQAESNHLLDKSNQLLEE